MLLSFNNGRVVYETENFAKYMHVRKYAYKK